MSAKSPLRSKYRIEREKRNAEAIAKQPKFSYEEAVERANRLRKDIKPKTP